MKDHHQNKDEETPVENANELEDPEVKYKKGGYLLYITCSVFKKENEDVVEFLREKYPVTLVKQEVLKGYDMRADSMFAALLMNNE